MKMKMKMVMKIKTFFIIKITSKMDVFKYVYKLK